MNGISDFCKDNNLNVPFNKTEWLVGGKREGKIGKLMWGLRTMGPYGIGARL